MSDLSRHLAILAEPVRVRLLAALHQEELAVGELVRIVQLPQSTVSRHLKALKDAGWLARRAEGTAGWFRFDPSDLPDAVLHLWRVVGNDFRDSLLFGEDQARLAAVIEARASDASNFYGRVHAHWDALRTELFGSDYLNPALAALLPPETVVADLGCGTGETLALLSPVVRWAWGVDREAAMLDIAERRCAGFTNVELCRAGLEDLPLSSGSVDVALAVLSLHHVPEPVAAIREARRVLRPGGRLVIVDMQAHDRTDYRHTMGHLHLGFDEACVLRWCQEAGFMSCSARALSPSPEAQGPPLFLVIALV